MISWDFPWFNSTLPIIRLWLSWISFALVLETEYMTPPANYAYAALKVTECVSPYCAACSTQGHCACLLIALHAPLKVTECLLIALHAPLKVTECVSLLRCMLHSRSLSVCPYCATCSTQGHSVCACCAAFSTQGHWVCVSLLRCVLHSRSLIACLLIALYIPHKVTECVRCTLHSESHNVRVLLCCVSPTMVSDRLLFLKTSSYLYVCHHGLALHQAANGGDGTQIWIVVAKMLNRHWQTTDQWHFFSLRVVKWDNNCLF